MVVVILAAGYGTRLYPLTENTPKALLPVKGRSILQYLLDKLISPKAAEVAAQVKKIVLVSNHRYAQAFQDWLLQASVGLPWEVLDDGSTSEENRLGSMGDLAFAIRRMEEEKARLEGGKDGFKEDLLVLGSDNLFPDGLAGFLRFAQRAGNRGVTLGVYELPDRSQAHRYGVVQLDAELTGRIVSFQEKPKEPASSLVSTAIYYFPYPRLKWVLEYVRSHAAADALGSFIQWSISQETVFGFRFVGPWFDIGDIASYKNAEELFIP